MATDINSVVLVGRLTRDAVLRYSPSGSGFLSFTIAVNRAKRTNDGWAEEASFIDCVYFGQNSQSISQYLVKGKQVAIQGELRQSKWESDGQQRSRVDVVVNTLSLLSGANQGQSTGGSFSSQFSQRPQNQMMEPQAAPAAPEPQVPGPESFEDDSIPF